MTNRFAVAHVVLLAAWLGAAGFFGAFVAPAAFAALPTRALAGTLVARTLPPLFVAGIVVGTIVVATALARPRAIWRALLAGVLVLSCASSHLVIGARIDSLRNAIGPSLDALAPADPRRLMFGRLHALSVAGLGVGTLAATAALLLAAAAMRPGPSITAIARADEARHSWRFR